MPIVEYPPGTPFPGRIGRTADESSPAWPAAVRAPAGTPNVLFVVLDDTGFGHLGCYGSPIETPTFDRLAADGYPRRIAFRDNPPSHHGCTAGAAGQHSV